MINTDILPVEPEVKKRLQDFSSQYKRFANLHLEVVEATDSYATIQASQKGHKTRLSNEEITDRVKDLFKGEMPENYDIRLLVR